MTDYLREYLNINVLSIEYPNYSIYNYNNNNNNNNNNKYNKDTLMLQDSLAIHDYLLQYVE